MAYGDGAYGQTAYGAPGIGVVVKYGDSSIEISSDFLATSLRNRGLQGTIEINPDQTGILDRVRAGKASFSIAPDFSAIPLKILEASSEIVASTNIYGDLKRVRFGESNIEIIIDHWADLATACRISVDPSLVGIPSAIREAKALIEASPNLAGTVKRLRDVSSEVLNIGLTLEGVSIRKRDTGSAITLTTDLTGDTLRKRYGSISLSIELDAQASTGVIRGAVGALNIGLDLIGDPTSILGGESEVEIEPDLAASVIRDRGAGSNITVEANLTATGLRYKLLMTFSGSFSPGDEINIDTEELTIEDSAGNNIRDSFEVLDWLQVAPGGSTLIWEDSETGRTIEIEIEKEDRSV